MATRTRTAKVKTPKAKSSPSVDAADLKKRIAAALGDAESASAVLSLIDDLTNERDALAADNAWKELRIQQLTLLVYGRKTEKLSKDELAQLALAFGAEEGAATQGDPIVPRPTPPADHEDKTPSAGQGDTQAPEKEKKKRRPKSKTTIGPDVERIIALVTVSPEDRLCTCCNQEMAVIGHVDHSTLEFIPAKLVQRIERREKLACRDSACLKNRSISAKPEYFGTTLPLPVQRQRVLTNNKSRYFRGRPWNAYGGVFLLYSTIGTRSASPAADIHASAKWRVSYDGTHDPASDPICAHS